jgi:hypothetical protein
VPRPVVPVGVAATAGRHQVVGAIVTGVAIEVIRADGRPRQGAATPVADLVTRADFVKQDESAHEHLPIPPGKRMIGQVSGWSEDRHESHSSLPGRTTDPGQLATAMQVDKPAPVAPDQLDLLEGLPA